MGSITMSPEGVAAMLPCVEDDGQVGDGATESGAVSCSPDWSPLPETGCVAPAVTSWHHEWPTAFPQAKWLPICK